MTSVKNVYGLTSSQDNMNFNGLNRLKVNTSTKSIDMITFGDDDDEENKDDDNDVNKNDVNAYQNVLSLHVHPDDDDVIDSLPGDNGNDKDDANEESDDIIGPLTKSNFPGFSRNNYYHSRIHHPYPFTGSSWALSERNCSLSSNALNKIMVNRGASSMSTHSESSSFSPLSRTSSSSSHHDQTNHSRESVKSLSSQRSKSEKVILLPRLSIQKGSIKGNQINDSTHHGSTNSRSKFWCDKISSNANSKVSISNGKDNSVLRLHVSGQSKPKPNEPISIITQEARSLSANRYERLEPIEQSSSSSLSNHSANSNLLQLKSPANGPVDQRTWRQCKNSTEVILVANSRDYSSSIKAKTKSKRKYDQPSRLTPEQQLARYHRQFTCEAVSLIVLIIAVTFLIATPFILVPMVALPGINHDLIRVLLCLSLILSVIFTIIGAFIGNVYWYFDEESSTFRWRLHFGSGPKHYWGTTLFNFTNNQSNQGANVHNQPPKQSHYNSAINNV
ncbi:eisosome protein SEG2-like [Tetranychus urticae]|uniref:eisosome protein SEG2-like n=1 Tax=Tetranychus urticae TaxID=32264 RepID=UPI00077B8C2C|nr:eisosome protein SEG2-like [Tetranychus urticae]